MNQSIHQPNNQLISEWRNEKKVPCARHHPQRFARIAWSNEGMVALRWQRGQCCPDQWASPVRPCVVQSFGLLATALLLTLLLSFPPSRVGIDAEHLARYLRVRNPIHLYLSPTQVWPRVLHSISTHDCNNNKKKKAFKRRQAGTSLVVQWLQIHLPVQGVPSLAWEVIFSTQGLHPHLLLGERALYHWITKEALCLL